MFFWIIVAFIALQFTSGITEFIATNKAASKTVGALGWLASKIGLAPSIITTRVLIIAVAVLAYLFVPAWVSSLLLVAAVWYLYKTGKYLMLWSSLKSAAESAVVKDVVNDVEKKL